ncbi:MAG: J domain-containing protein [Pseudomonadota bacterium]
MAMYTPLILVFMSVESHNPEMWYDKIKSYWDTLDDPQKTALTPVRVCDVAGCLHQGEYKAPKSRQALKEYYWFCLDHVREYNQNWDFFKGMSRAEIETHMCMTVVWDRPAWRSTWAGFNEERLKKTLYERFADGGDVFQAFMAGGEGEKAHIDVRSIPHPALEALAVMNLQPPIVWEEVKARYKTLAKRYHPDAVASGASDEEMFKKINLAYSLLKLSYQNYAKLDEK